jgi:hypothetical protein
MHWNFISLYFFSQWLLHVSAKQCHPQGATIFLSEPLPRQYGRRQVIGRMMELSRYTTKHTDSADKNNGPEENTYGLARSPLFQNLAPPTPSGNLLVYGAHGFLSGESTYDPISNGLYWLHAADALENLSVLQQDKICGKLSRSFLKQATIPRAERYKNGDTVCCSTCYHVLWWLALERDTRLPPFGLYCIEFLPVILPIMGRLPFPAPFVILF